MSALDSPRTAAEEVVCDLVRTVFRQGRVREGFERLVADAYVQHNPDVADGREAAIGFFESLWQDFPSFLYDVHHVVADGDLVAVHAHATVGVLDDHGRAIIDLFRVSDGLVVEHRDAVQDEPEQTASGRSMFDDEHPARSEAPGSEAVVRDLLASASRGPALVREGVERTTSINYAQHNPRVADGREATIGFFEGLWSFFPTSHHDVKHLLVSDDLVLVHAHGDNRVDRGAAVMDLFRVADAQIVEHWDVVQMVPEQSANDHPMFWCRCRGARCEPGRREHVLQRLS